MGNKIKTVVCLHDLSFAGGCSLSAIMPIIAASGCECVPLPTALFSAHTGFGTPRRLDTAGFAAESVGHIKTIGIQPDIIYSGYILNREGAQAVYAARNAFPAAFRLHDPAFADSGRMYSGLEPEVLDCHRELAADSGLMLPNLTEALMLCGLSPPRKLSEGMLRELCVKLLAEFAIEVVITGVELDGESCNVVATPGGINRLRYNRIPGNYPGTGDVFGALIAAELTKKTPTVEAVRRAASIIEATIRKTNSINRDYLYGLEIGYAVREVILDENK